MTTSSAGKDAQQLELSHSSDRIVKWYNHFGKKFGSLLKSYIVPIYLSIPLLEVPVNL